MEYKIRIKNLNEGDKPEKDYTFSGNGFQCQRVSEVPADVDHAQGVVLARLLARKGSELLKGMIPEGKTLEIIFKD